MTKGPNDRIMATIHAFPGWTTACFSNIVLMAPLLSSCMSAQAGPDERRSAAEHSITGTIRDVRPYYSQSFGDIFTIQASVLHDVFDGRIYPERGRYFACQIHSGTGRDVSANPRAVLYFPRGYSINQNNDEFAVFEIASVDISEAYRRGKAATGAADIQLTIRSILVVDHAIVRFPFYK